MRSLTAVLAPLTLCLVLLLGLLGSASLAEAAPHYDDDAKSLVERDAQTWRDMTLQILQQLVRANADFAPIYHHKRNSEIINSLLGLPKTMSDAGRK